MNVSSDLWLGDLLRACDALQSSRHTTAEIAAALGFTTALVDLDEPDEDLRQDERDVAPAPSPTAPDAAANVVDAPARATPGAASPPELRILAPVGRIDSPTGDDGGEDPVGHETAQHFDRPDRLEPLLRPAWTTGIVYAAAATPSPRGAIDVDRLVADVARRKPVDRVPRLPRGSLSRGVQLLVDIGEGMQPFLRDQRQLADAISTTVGAELVRQLRCRGCPTTGEGCGPGPVSTWTAYSPPEPGTPVIVLSDLGIAGPADAPRRDLLPAWLELAELLSRTGSRLTAFVPYASDRYPPALRIRISVVPWDRTTDVAVVRQILHSVDR